MKQMGRPKKEFSIEQFEKLCALQCTELEICAWFSICEDTLNSRCKENYEGQTFSDVSKLKRKAGLISLRRNQWKLAENNAAMAIWLGKQHLNQRDEKHFDHTTNGDKITSPQVSDKILSEIYNKHLEEQDDSQSNNS